MAHPAARRGQAGSAGSQLPRRSTPIAFHGPVVIFERGEYDGPWQLTGAESDQVLGCEYKWTHRVIGAAADRFDENLFRDL